MTKIGTFIGLIILLGALWLLFQGAHGVKGAQSFYSFAPQVYKMAGPTATSTSIPGPTAIPGPTETPIPFTDPSYIQRTVGAIWQLKQVNMLPCERASGSNIIYITALDKVGNPLDGINVEVVGQASGIIFIALTGTKAPGKAEVPVGRDSWDSWVIGDGKSDQAMNMREDLPNDPNCSGRFGNHYEYEEVFQRKY